MSEHRFERPTIFSATCNRLTQYLRENGGLGIAPLTQEPTTTKANGVFRPTATMSLLPGAVVPTDDPTTDPITDGVVSGPKTTKSMNLFPQHAGFGAADDKKENSKKQLTIFYGGKVLVFDDFPPDKARDLMLMAGIGGPATSAVADRLPTVASTGHSTASASGSLIKKDVPIARRASLHRFLEKRKERINSKAPYHVSGSPTPVAVDPTKTWLGLGQHLSTPAPSSEREQKMTEFLIGSNQHCVD